MKGKTILRDGNGLVFKNKSIASTNLKTLSTLSVGEQTTSKSVVVFEDSSLGNTEISRPDINLEMKGESKVTGFTISSNVIITAPSTVTLPKVTILAGADHVELNANVGEVEVNRAGEVSLTGQGKIATLITANKDAKFTVGENTKITNLQLPEGIQPSNVISNYEQIKENIEKVPGQSNPGTPGTPGTPSTPSTPSTPPDSNQVDEVPYLKNVALLIGSESFPATPDGNGNFSVSLANLSNTDMFTKINLQASEKITGTVTFFSETKDISTDDSGTASLIISEILGELDSQKDGVSVKTLRNYLKLLGNTMTVELTDATGNEETFTVTIKND